MTEISKAEDIVDIGAGPETEADTPVRSPGGIKTGRLSLFVAAIALLVGAAALAIHVQPQLLGPMAPLTFKPAPQQAALTLLGRRLDTIESRLAEDLKSLEVLQDRQAALLTMASQINTLAQEMEVIASRLDSVRHGIDAVSAGTSNPDVNDRLEWLEEQMRMLEAQISQGETSSNNSAAMLMELSRRLEIISTRTRSLEVIQPDHVAGAAAVALAVGQLRLSILDGQPYSASLANVKALLVSEGTLMVDISAALDELEQEASDGVMTIAALRQGLADQSAVILRAGTSEATGWMDKTLRRLATMITVRRTGEVSGPGTEAHLARAEARLHEDKLDEAVSEMSGLVGAAANAAAFWLEAARARLAIDAALSKLEVYAVSRITNIYEATQVDQTIQ